MKKYIVALFLGISIFGASLQACSPDFFIEESSIESNDEDNGSEQEESFPV